MLPVWPRSLAVPVSVDEPLSLEATVAATVIKSERDWLFASTRTICGDKVYSRKVKVKGANAFEELRQ